ncbi:MAG: hypothetical protein HFG16_07890 [Erysipelotrichaceae bacterium]|jgi:hypothetical protein|nr:hypothetical protein [Erysipelotrichaceae bacterium]
MKKISAIAICLLLAGCARLWESDLPQTVQTFLENQSTSFEALGANHSKNYYKYYLPLDMGTRESTQLGEVLIKGESLILMNFDPSSIIMYTYYGSDAEQSEKEEKERQQAREDGSVKNDDENAAGTVNDVNTAATTSLQDDDLSIVKMQNNGDIIVYKGAYRTHAQAYYPYTLSIARYNGQYLIYLDGSIVEFYTLTPLANVMSDLKSMFLIMKSITFDTDEVLHDFSMKNATTSRQQSIDSLQQNLPSVGSIPDLLEQMEQLSGNR